jgi:hypothetical protein
MAETVSCRRYQLAAPEEVINARRNGFFKNIQNRNQIEHAETHAHQRRNDNEDQCADPAAGDDNP